MRKYSKARKQLLQAAAHQIEVLDKNKGTKEQEKEAYNTFVRLAHEYIRLKPH